MKPFLKEKLKDFKSLFVKFAVNNFAFITIILLFNLTIFYVASSFGRGVHLFLYATCLVTLIALFTECTINKIIRSIVRKTIIIFAGIVFIGDLFFIYHYKGLPDRAIIEVLLATNVSETWEYVETNLQHWYLYVALIVITFVIYAAIKILKKISCKPKVGAIFAFYLFFAIVFTTVNVVKDFFRQSDTTIGYLERRCCPLVRTITNVCEGITNMRNFERMLKAGNTKPKILSNKSSIPYFVYILGESTSRHYMGIYGYHLNNTPYMNKRYMKGELLRFNDVISPHGMTILVLQDLFTFYRQHAKGQWYNYTDLFSILRAAGYNTTWLSNQEYSGSYGNHGRIYAEHCNNKAFTRLRADDGFNMKEPYDESLLPLLDKTLKHNKSKKNFIVLHLYGTHTRYSERYPKTFKEYSTKQVKGSNKEMKELRACYSTAVRYNDSIMNAIIKRFENKDAIVIYTSDHGEDLMDINDKVAGHSEVGINTRMVEIPMLIYLSKTFRSKRPELAKRIQLSINRPFMTDDMIHSILDIMGIKTSGYNPKLSVFNKQFDAKRKRYCGKKLYRKES